MFLRLLLPYSCHHRHVASLGSRYTCKKSFSTESKGPTSFVLDIDGVLKHGKLPLQVGKDTLSYLAGNNPTGRKYPFILLTNGGGVDDNDRRLALSKELEVDLNPSQVVQSHTIFKNMSQSVKEAPTLVVGGKGQACSIIAEKTYGFKNVYSPVDLCASKPELWPFVAVRPDKDSNGVLRQGDFSKINFESVFMFHDSQDWGRDIQIMIDILSSQNGTLGVQKDVNDPSQWRKELQPRLVFSNPDLIWRNEFPISRLGQGGFQSALKSVWKDRFGHELFSETWGKPSKQTYEFATKMLRAVHAIDNSQSEEEVNLGSIYMIGDNPESDIAGANAAGWNSILVKTGVYQRPGYDLNDPYLPHKPTIIKENVLEGIKWAIERENGL